jgi:hypothetical protein
MWESVRIINAFSKDKQSESVSIKAEIIRFRRFYVKKKVYKFDVAACAK